MQVHGVPMYIVGLVLMFNLPIISVYQCVHAVLLHVF